FGVKGPSASFTVVISASTATLRGSNVTIVSPVSRLTCARVTPGTLSSADRTATRHPSQAMPPIVNVTVANWGEVRHALAQRATVTSNWRLVMGVCPPRAITSQKSDCKHGIVDWGRGAAFSARADAPDYETQKCNRHLGSESPRASRLPAS